ncbi:cyclic nucleotide-gated ion channel 1, partial [Tanacetum coccineum]
MRKTLNPRGKFLQKWNKIFVLSCVIVVSVDPLFFYIPIVKDVKKCLDLDNKLRITASVLRSFTDIFYIVHIIFQFRTSFIAPSSRVFGRGVLVEDEWEIAKRYISSYFLVDILAVLPLLPQ